MKTVKQDAAALISALPDDVNMEDIQYRLYVLDKIRAGLADIDAGRIVPHEEAVRRLARWRVS